MAILDIVTQQVGLVGVTPKWIYIATNDTLATVTTTGFLNAAAQQGYTFSEADIALVSTKTSPGATDTQVAMLEVSHVGQNWSLVPTGSPGQVVLPTIASHIATYTNTTGTLSEDASTAINGGNIQAGLSGTAGYFASFPSTAAKGSLRLTAVANTNDTLTTLSNVAMGQASVVSIPDPVNAVARLLIGATATPFVNGNFPMNSGTGGLMVDSGVAVSDILTTTDAVLLTPAADQTITAFDLIVGAGNLQAGVSGVAGTLISFPGTPANGSLIIAAVDAGAAFNTTISNSVMGQSSVISIPDPGVATSEFIIADFAGTQHITSGGLQADIGPISIGLSAGGANGLLTVYPNPGSAGFLALAAVQNTTGDFGLTLSNAATQGQATVLTITDVGAATGFLNPQSVSAETTPAGVMITKDITLGFAALAAGGTVDVQAALAGAQFKVRDIFVNYGAAGLSGGGGDRLVTLTDGTTVYNDTGITAALLGTPANTVWGATGNPVAGAVAQSTATVAGQALRFIYAGGSTDYTAGEVVVTVAYERVA